MKNYIFWDLTPWSPLKLTRRFGGKYLLHLQTRLIFRPWSWKQHVPPKRLLTFKGLHGVVSQEAELFIKTACWIQEYVYVFICNYFVLVQTSGKQTSPTFNTQWQRSEIILIQHIYCTADYCRATSDSLDISHNRFSVRMRESAVMYDRSICPWCGTADHEFVSQAMSQFCTIYHHALHRSRSCGLAMRKWKKPRRNITYGFHSFCLYGTELNME
jgi:hypothetical protein